MAGDLEALVARRVDPKSGDLEVDHRDRVMEALEEVQEVRHVVARSSVVVLQVVLQVAHVVRVGLHGLVAQVVSVPVLGARCGVVHRID